MKSIIALFLVMVLTLSNTPVNIAFAEGYHALDMVVYDEVDDYDYEEVDETVPDVEVDENAIPKPEVEYDVVEDESVLDETDDLDDTTVFDDGEDVDEEDLDLPGDHIGIMPLIWSFPAVSLIYNGVIEPRSGFNNLDQSQADWFFTNPSGTFNLSHPSLNHSEYRVAHSTDGGGSYNLPPLWRPWSAIEANRTLSFNPNTYEEGIWVLEFTIMTAGGMARQSIFLYINIQRTRSFVDIDGQRNSSASTPSQSSDGLAIVNHTLLEPIVNPSTIAVGRVDEYSHWGEICDERSDWFVMNLDTGDVFRPGDIVPITGEIFNANDPSTLGTGRFQVVNRIYENMPLRGLYQPYWDVDMPFPFYEVRHESTGYFVNTVNFDFTKHNDDGQPLPGAIFTLERYLPNANPTLDGTWQAIAGSPATSATTGAVSFEGLMPGTILPLNTNPYFEVVYAEYRLREYSAPNGFVRPAGYWIIEVDATGEITITEHYGNPAFRGNAEDGFSVANYPLLPFLEITKAVDYATREVGDDVIYTIVITNTGEAPALGFWMIDDLTHLIVDDEFLGGVELYTVAVDCDDDLSAVGHYEFNATNNRVTVEIERLEVGATITITVTATVLEDAEGETFTNTAVLYADEDGTTRLRNRIRVRDEYTGEYEIVYDEYDLYDDATVTVPDPTTPPPPPNGTPPTDPPTNGGNGGGNGGGGTGGGGSGGGSWISTTPTPPTTPPTTTPPTEPPTVPPTPYPQTPPTYYEIYEEDIPLAPYPPTAETPPPSEPAEPDTPDTPDRPRRENPQTGDITNNTGLMISLVGLLLALVAVAVLLKKQNYTAVTATAAPIKIARAKPIDLPLRSKPYVGNYKSADSEKQKPLIGFRESRK
jgi:LPXTG-motif cell wall-anchored protein